MTKYFIDMKKFPIIFLLTILSVSVLAQRNRQVDKEKLEAARVAFITNRLSLSPEQAEKFWPLFNEFQDKRNGMMRELRGISKKGEEDISNSQARELIKKRFDIQENLLAAEKVFLSKIANELSHVQALKLNEVNRDFTRHIYRMQKRDRSPRQE
jgi:biopolymer transport protein ExbB/TolQ